MRKTQTAPILRWIAFLLCTVMLSGAMFACAPVTPPTDDNTPDQGDTPGEDQPPEETPPASTLPDDISISFYVATEEEKPCLHQVSGNHFDPSGNRFFDQNFYLIYRFPTHAAHKNTELVINLANQYEVSASADGKTFDVLASTLEYQQGAQKLVLDLSSYRPTEGDGYIYIKLGDADKSDGWGGNLPKNMPIRYFSGISAISVAADETVRKGDMLMYRYDLTPGCETENEFILRDGSSFTDMGARPFRLCDGSREIVYMFRGTPGQLAYVTMDLSHEYLIELSTDDQSYEEIVNFMEWGRYRDWRSIDLSSYFADSDTVYLRVSDYEPEDGWGPQIRGMSYTVLTGGEVDAASFTVNDGWKMTLDGKTSDYNAGEVVLAGKGKAVTFEKTVSVPADYVTARAISFAYIEGVVANTVVTVNGKIAEKISGSANTITVALPDGVGNTDSFTVKIATVVGESGKTGLWKNVRLGMADMIRYPETSRSLGDVTRPFTYAEQPYDQVTLNALAGNFLQSLYNAELGINSFDSSMTIQSLYYTGDTARALIALAYEEVYSPIVRLEYAMGIYDTLIDAMVPTSDTHCFLKYDTRPKRVTQKGNALLWQNTQDVIEPFADMYLLPGNATESNVTLSYHRVSEDKDYNGTAEATSKFGSAAINANISWFSGTSDKATVAELSAQNCDTYRVVIRFDTHGTTMKSVAADEEVVATLKGKTEIELDTTNAYFVFDDLMWNTNGVVVATDLLPTSATMIPTADGSKFAALVLEFEGDEEPIISAVQLGGIDTDLEYAYYVMDHMMDDFTYGTNGYDPSYLADHSLGALAAGAYLMKKYEVDGWQDAVERAATALKTCEKQIARNYIPSYWQSAIAGCHFMVLMDEDVATFKTLAAKWADRIVSGQNADGSYTWLESRNPIATLTAYDITGNEKYLTAARRWLEANEYTDEGVIYRGQLYSETSFTGTGDLILMNRFGYDDPLGIILAIEGSNIDDSGFFACSDINPYYLGYSLADLMNVEYDIEEKKAQIPLGQYVMYDADGHYTVTDCPSVYVNNPYQ